MSKGAVLIISGPSGCGKSTLTKALKESVPDVYFSISTTTRKKREGEIEGVHYHFVDREQFLQDIKQNVFLEWAEVHTNFYGTSLKPVEKALSEDKIVLFDVDVQGHQSIKAHFGDFAKSIFITTKTKEILKDRLVARGSDDMQMIEYRLEKAYSEMQHLQYFDYVLINDDIESAKEAIIAIARSLKYQQIERFSEIIRKWQS
ncbi:MULTISPECIES: guanylate kinase [Helicobacter]|uniref:Guanylate kinase n=1 Tax=Helicobacter typhlonius TaxID=76936 RepID=A0A099UCX3_9HELI|nr:MULTISPECIES: guanylate kinase [Helicobacter]TLD78248.1 guanylate kinase [Helicobacter typhlonius]TLD86900.1 guanylate kinase [Helicobacter sp. MIT 03-1616]CUU40734.1 Guanylate kinase [Helicobacter typhlonius]HCD73100.1 guanylate kinase [Helicobacter sp.]